MNIAKCYQNIDIDLTDSQVDKLVVWQDESGCKTQFTKKRGGKVSSNKDSRGDTSAESVDDKVPSDQHDAYVKIFIFIMFIFALYTFVLEPMMNEDVEDERPEVYYHY